MGRPAPGNFLDALRQFRFTRRRPDARADFFHLIERRDGHLAAPGQRSFRAGRDPGPSSLAGGAPREMLDNVFWADWTPDGQSLAVIRARREYAKSPRVSCGNGDLRSASLGQPRPLLAQRKLPCHRRSCDRRRQRPRRHSRHARKCQGPLELLLERRRLSLGSERQGSLVLRRPGRIGSLNLRARFLRQRASDLSLARRAYDSRHQPFGPVLLTADKARIGSPRSRLGRRSERSLSWFDWSLLTESLPTARTSCSPRPAKPSATTTDLSPCDRRLARGSPGKVALPDYLPMANGLPNPVPRGRSLFFLLASAKPVNLATPNSTLPGQLGCPTASPSCIHSPSPATACAPTVSLQGGAPRAITPRESPAPWFLPTANTFSPSTTSVSAGSIPWAAESRRNSPSPFQPMSAA